MRDLRLFVGLAAILLEFALAPHAAGRADAAGFLYDADLQAPGAARLDGDTWVVEDPTCTIRLQRLEEDERRRFLAHAARCEVDPYASRAGSAPRFLTFLLQVENRGDGVLMLQPERTWLRTSQPKVLTAVGLEALRATFEMVGQPFPPAYEKARPAVLEGSRFIEPGASTAGLLVFHAVERKARAFRVEVTLTGLDGRQIGLVAPYRRTKKARQKERR